MELVSAAIVAAKGLGVKTALLGPSPIRPVVIDVSNREAAGATDGRRVTEPEYLGDYAPSEKPWELHRAQADAITEIYRVGGEEFQRYAERVFQCSEVLDYAWIEDKHTRQTGELRFKLRGARFCRVRTCPVCQWRRSLMWFARFTKALDKVLKENPSSISFIFLTITVRNCEVSDLRASLKTMGQAWKRFIMRKEFANIQGWIRTTEVTYGQGGTAHPHYHVLLMVRNSWFKKSYVSQASWTEAWKEAGRLDYDPVVDVRKVKGDVREAAAETLKYAVKPQDAITNPSWFLELTRQIRKLRFIGAGGVFKDAFREEDETQQELLLMDGEPDPDEQIEHGPRVPFGWARPVQRYKRMKG